MSTDSGGSAALLLILYLVASWVFVYTAVRVAVGHALDRVKPRLLAETHTAEAGVDFVVTNVGTGPAFELSVRWLDDPVKGVLAHTPLLAVNGKLEWTIVAGPVPDEAQSVRRLRLEWSLGLDSSLGRQSGARAVLVPSRLSLSQ